MESSIAPDVELKSFEGVDCPTAKLLESESVFIAKEEDIESEVPPQVKARGRAAIAIPLKPGLLNGMMDEQAALISTSESQENIEEVTNL